VIAFTRKLAAGVVLVAVVICALTVLSRGFWSFKVAESLTCTEDIVASDAVLLENFDPSFPLFKRAAELHHTGFAHRILVPTPTGNPGDLPDSIAVALTNVMAEAAQIKKMDFIPIVEREPITLSAAQQIRDFLTHENVRSVIVVTPGFRSERSFRIYNKIFSRAGIQLRCAPVFGRTNQKNWLKTWHGVQEVALQVLKSAYYRLFVSV
jgi:hypothetical protein